MEEIRLDSGVKKIAIKDEDDEVIAVLRINVADLINYWHVRKA